MKSLLVGLMASFLWGAVQAGEYEYVLEQNTFNISGEMINEVVTDDFRVPYSVYMVEPGSSEPVYDWVCTTSYTGNQGKGNWERYYNVSGDRAKAQALKKAILGVGKKRSKYLAENRYFIPKPRTWGAFIAELERAERNGGLSGLTKSVTSGDYGERNMRNLGYDYSDDRNCSWELTGYRTTQPIREHIRSGFLNLKVRVGKLTLQKGENQQVKLSVGQPDDRGELTWSVSGGTYHKLNIVGQSREFVDSGDRFSPSEELYLLDIDARRILRKPNINDLDVVFSKAGSNKMRLVVNDSRAGREGDLSGPGVIYVEILEDGFWWNNDSIMTEVFELNKDKALSQFEIKGPFNGKEIFIKVSMTRPESLVHSSDMSYIYESKSKDF